MAPLPAKFVKYDGNLPRRSTGASRELGGIGLKERIFFLFRCGKAIFGKLSLFFKTDSPVCAV